jgi:rhodanese-related sulfurtransferase
MKRDLRRRRGNVRIMSSRTVVSPYLAALSLVAVVGLAACGSSPGGGAAGAGAPSDPSQKTASTSAEKVDGAKAKKLVAGGARLVDVRGADEFAAKHVEGAENAPVETIEDRDLGAKDSPLVLYCSSGARSERAAATLRSKGYTHVYVLGAMSNWDK